MIKQEMVPFVDSNPVIPSWTPTPGTRMHPRQYPTLVVRGGSVQKASAMRVEGYGWGEAQALMVAGIPA